jgi:hypothetical protein
VKRVAGALAVIGAMLIAIAACSLPVDDRATPIDPDQLRPALVNTTTTTTTAPPTTLPAQTVPPDTSSTDDSTPTTTTTTTVVPTLTTRVSLFYTIRLTNELQRFQRPMNDGVTLAQVQSELEQPQPDVSAFDLRSSVRPGLISSLVLDRGTLTIALDQATFEAMPEQQRQRAIAQIVLTFTSFATADAGAVGGVVFQIDGQGIAVFVPATEIQSEVGAELSYEDFEPWIAGNTVTNPPESTVPVSPPGTTQPPVSSSLPG